MEACCTCATLLSAAPRTWALTLTSTARDGDIHSEKESPVLAPTRPEDRRLQCCTRVICGNCIHNNARFNTYCPYCQISTGPSTLPPRLRDPPPYTTMAFQPSLSLAAETEVPPPYQDPPPLLPGVGTKLASDPSSENENENEKADAHPDTLHFLHHEHDTVASLSLRYGVPASALRAANKLTSDHLLVARRAVVIPGAYYKGGVSLSPRPVEGEEEEARKAKIRRWMVTCKVADYEIAVLYLEQAAYDLDAALEAYFADDEWEKAHPLESKGRTGRSGAGNGRWAGFGKGRDGREMGGTRASQAAFLRRK